MSYQPNLNDPRIQNRVCLAIKFAEARVNDSPKQISQNLLNSHFGQQQNPLSKYLREKLLVVVSHSYSFGKGNKKRCKSYQINKVGLAELQNQVAIIFGECPNPHYITSLNPQRKEDAVIIRFGKELQSNQVKYNDTASRFYHWLQNTEKQEKQKILEENGFHYHYDIQCAAPTLIMQYAEQCEMDLYLFALRAYLKDRKTLRQRLASNIGCTEKQAKGLINAMLNGAPLSPVKDSSVMEILESNLTMLQKAQNDLFLKNLREDFNVCWEYIKPYGYKRTIVNKKGRTQDLRMNGKMKSAVYRNQERKVLDVVIDYCNATGNEIYREHDGWSSRLPIDIPDLIQVIRSKTGFRINIDIAGE